MLSSRSGAIPALQQQQQQPWQRQHSERHASSHRWVRPGNLVRSGVQSIVLWEVVRAWMIVLLAVTTTTTTTTTPTTTNLPTETSSLLAPHTPTAHDAAASTFSFATNNNTHGAQSPFAIFYQIYVPLKRQKGPANSLRVVGKQMGQIRQAVVEFFVHHDKNHATTTTKTTTTTPVVVTLYYLTLGLWLDDWNATAFQRTYCDNNETDAVLLQCRHLQHVAQGSEDFTLHHLYQYCHRATTKTTTHRVVYLHSKGTFDIHFKNERWRYHLTAAALHADCLQPPDADQHCDTCGLTFYTEWTNFYPGNMWNADCRYVRRLMSPLAFDPAMDRAVATILRWQHRRVLASGLYPEKMDRYGLNRYHSEHWIGSHPTLRPCDMSAGTKRFEAWRMGKLKPEKLAFAAKPHHRGGPVPNDGVVVPPIPDTRREIFGLPGLLIKHNLWYGEYPPQDSWMWQWYPHGDFWWRAVQNYGPDAVPLALWEPENATTTASSTTIPPWNDTQQLFSEPRPVGRRRAEGGSVGGLSWPLFQRPQTTQQMSNMVIFLTIEEPAKMSALTQAWDNLAAECDKASSTLPATTITYFSVESKTMEMEQALAQHALCTTRGRACQKGENSLFLGDRYQSIHQHCREHKVDLVWNIPMTMAKPRSWWSLGKNETTTNINNNNDDADFSWLRAPCLDCLQRGTCDVCGPQLVAAHDVAYRGNLWGARCAYVHQLLSPLDYVEGLATRVTDEILLRKLGDQIHWYLLPREAYIPQGEAILDHWITSHPLVHPASVLPVMSYWKDLGESHNPDSRVKELIKRDSRRVRECAFLVCYLVRWHVLYNAITPSNTSFIWQDNLFPDQERWRQSTKSDEGIKAFLKVVQPYVNHKV